MEKGITKLSVAGFKSISKETTLDIKPLTLLAGANSSGKSSFIQPLLLLKQTLEAPHDPGPLLLNGDNVKFTMLDQFFSTANHEPTNEFSVGFQDSYSFFKTTFCRKSNMNKHDKRLVVNSNYYQTKRNGPIIHIHPTITKEEAVKQLRLFKNSSKSERLESYIEQMEKDNRSIEITQDRFFLSIDLYLRAFRFVFPPFEYSLRPRVITELFRVIHVPGLRGNPERVYQARGIGPRFPGTFEEYTASLIAHWVEKEPSNLKTLCAYLNKLGLTSDISASHPNDAQIEVVVGRLLKNRQRKSDMVSIADVGFGVSQVLPVLVALLVAKPGQLVYLEQPEIHLHPLAQKKLGEILVDTANRGVKVVVETHSSLLLLAVQTLIAKQKIDKDNVALHWFQRSKSGMTDVKTAKLDKAGCFGNWPVDFGEVELDAEGDFIEAVALRRMRR